MHFTPHGKARLQGRLSSHGSHPALLRCCRPLVPMHAERTVPLPSRLAGCPRGSSPHSPAESHGLLVVRRGLNVLPCVGHPNAGAVAQASHGGALPLAHPIQDLQGRGSNASTITDCSRTSRGAPERTVAGAAMLAQPAGPACTPNEAQQVAGFILTSANFAE